MRRAAALAACLLLAWHPAGAEDDAAADNAVKLEALRERIRGVEAGIQAARGESEAILAELQQTEAALAEARAAMRRIEERLGAQEARLRELERERAARQEALEAARALLAAQIRAAYRAGRNDFVKLLLNQEDPALVGRVLVYHDYFSRARADGIAAVSAAMERLDALEMEIRAETLTLGELREQQAAKLHELTAHLDSRSAVMARLDRHIRERDEELRHLQENERQLAALIERLKEDPVAAAFEELPPFETLKGRLSWPVDGRQAETFGAPRKGGRLRAEGVTIAADAGTEVRAVAAGTVVFADWFRNMGLLIIIDHGGGYMSLYGHNEALAKKPGDFVRAGDVIGRVGDTGGREQAGLYFEIRAEGRPVDPALWCRRG